MDFSKLMKDMEGFDFSGANKQAQNFWEFLDDLAAQNPDDYKKFISKQLKEGSTAVREMEKEKNAPPYLPGFCVSCPGDLGKPMYLNICQSEKIPAPKTDEESVPVSITRPRSEEKYDAADIVFNPSVVARAKKERLFWDQLVHLAADCVEETQGRSLTRTYTRHSATYMGEPPKTKEDMKGSSADDDLNRIPKAFRLDPKANKSTPNVSSNAGLLGLNLKPEGSQPKPSAESSKATGAASKARKPLIEEIGNTVAEPSFTLTDSDDGLSAVLRVELPMIEKASQAAVDISDKDFVVEVVDHCALRRAWPRKVDEERAAAKFEKKKKVLRITVPYS